MRHFQASRHPRKIRARPIRGALLEQAMTTLTTKLAICAALAFPFTALAHNGETHAATPAVAAPAAAPSAKLAATQAALRDLWVEHVFWIRNYVQASADHHDAEKKVAADQVVANATAISGAIASYYGKPAGDQMLTLLAGHWTAVKDYSDATFAKDAAAQKTATTHIVDNAKAIAAFLAKANPYLPEATLVGLLSAHGAHHIAQIGQLSKGDYAGEAQTWKAMRLHMFTIADALAGALAKQFPAKF
jgi:hypothetical protein